MVKPKTTPPQVRKAEQEAHKKEHEEALKKAYEAIEKYKHEAEAWEKSQIETMKERDLFKLAFRQYDNMNEKLKDKLYFQFGQLNHLRREIHDPQIPKEFLKEEIDEMWNQAVEETKE